MRIEFIMYKYVSTYIYQNSVVTYKYIFLSFKVKLSLPHPFKCAPANVPSYKLPRLTNHITTRPKTPLTMQLRVNKWNGVLFDG